MQWSQVRAAYPDQWLVIEALEAHTRESRPYAERATLDENGRARAETDSSDFQTSDFSVRQRVLDRIAVIEICSDGKAAMNCYRQLHHQYPLREFYFVHTSRKELDIVESPSVSVWRQHAVLSGA